MASFVIPEKKGRLLEEDKRFGEEQIRELVEEQMKDVKTRVSDAVDETIQYAVEKTERSMERVTNEKIMAVNEYSDTVLEEIHKNHEEVVFLYDMLNDKQQNIKDTAAAVEKKAKEVRESILQETSVTAETAREVSGREEKSEQTFVPLNIADQTTVSEEERVIRGVEPQSGEAVQNPEAQDAAAQNITMQDTEAKSSAALDMAAQDGPEYGDAGKSSKTENVKTEKPRKRASGRAAKAAGAKERGGAMPAVGLSFANSGEEGRNNNEKILALYKAGKSNMAIAKELGLGIGEVKLVIDLFKGV